MKRTLYEHASGETGMHSFMKAFFGHGYSPIQSFSHPSARANPITSRSPPGASPDDFTRGMGGFSGLIDAHRHPNIAEGQRQRFVAPYPSVADEVGMPADCFAPTESPPF